MKELVKPKKFERNYQTIKGFDESSCGGSGVCNKVCCGRRDQSANRSGDSFDKDEILF